MENRTSSDRFSDVAPVGAPPKAGDGMTLGIVSLVFGVLGFVPTFGIVAAIVGLITGSIGKKQARAAGDSTAVTISAIGFVLSAITLVIALLMRLLFGGLVGALFSGR